MSELNHDRHHQDRPDHEAILRALLTGDATPDEQHVREALAQSPSLRAEWAALRDAQQRLVHEDRERDRILREIQGAEPTAEEAAALATLRTIMDAAPRAAPPRRAWRATLLIAAAAIAVIAIWLPWDRMFERDRPRSDTLGRVIKIELLAPVGPVTGYGTFRWQAPDTSVVHYKMVLLHKDATGALTEIKLVAKLREPSYVPDETLPPRIIWRVLAFDRFDTLVAKGEAEAYLSGN